MTKKTYREKHIELQGETEQITNFVALIKSVKEIIISCGEIIPLDKGRAQVTISFNGGKIREIERLIKNKGGGIHWKELDMSDSY